MNLASRDIRRNIGRFTLTTFGVGVLLMIVMGMAGIYRGLVHEATLLVDTVGADLWIVQRATRGPFAEISRVPRSLTDRVAAVPGVENARAFVYHTLQRERGGKPLRMAVLGLDWPVDRGEWLPLWGGGPLTQNHFQMIADRSLGFRLGESLRLGKDTYRIVGLTAGMIDTGGNGFAFFTEQDARAVQFDQPGEATRLARASRSARTGRVDIGQAEPGLVERAGGLTANIPVLLPGQVSAVIARLAPGANRRAVLTTLNSWADVTAFTQNEQSDLLLRGVVEKARRQLGLFRTLLTIVSALIMALILYNMTLDKLHDIALLKLIGAPNHTILGLILQQAVVMGAFGFAIAYGLGMVLFPYFPRRVLLTGDDLVNLGLIVLGISVVASFLGIWKAMRVEPNAALMG
jgi:putative ABC transport system permease protein